jgi:AcrR family transcriptional regulator
VARGNTPVRILDAAVRCAGKIGLRRVTVDDIAKEAGLARVTLYSHFSAKEEILRAALLRELAAFLAALENEFARYDDPEVRVVETVVVAVRTLRSHEVVQHLLRTEPELLLPFLAGDSPPMGLAREWAATQMLSASDIDFAIDPQPGG